MGHYQTPTFETSTFEDEHVITTGKYEDESVFESKIVVRWKLNMIFDEAGVRSMSPEITWVQVVTYFQVDDFEADPQKQREGDTQYVNFTPESKGWDVTIEQNVKDTNNMYRCTSAYVNVDDQTAEIWFG